MVQKSILSVIFSLIIIQITNSQTLTFNPPLVFDAGYNSHMIIMADFNNDNLMDIATSNYSGDNVSILLAAKVDSFSSEVLYAAGDGAYDLINGDFNNDNITDLAVSNYIADNISVLLGIGDGTFSPKVDYAAGNGPKGIVVGDFNNDNIMDIAVALDLEDKISVFLGIGNGSFLPKVNYTAGDRPHDLLIGFINSDSFPDLITINRNDNDISVMAGNGNGSFQSPVFFNVGHYPQFATLGYFNNDALLDLAVCNTFNFDSVSILLGDNVTMFGQAQNYFAGDEPYAVTAADFNLDSKMDLAITNYAVDSITILFGGGDGSFTFAENLFTGNNPNGILAVDIEQDSDFDILNVNYLSGGSTHLHINTLCPTIEFNKSDLTMVNGNDGSATAYVTGGLEPYTYAWSGGMSLVDSAIINLSSGIYTLTITDSLGCFVTADVQINEPICNIELSTSTTPVSYIGGSDGQAMVETANGILPYEFLWNDPATQTDSMAINLSKGTYQVIVTDSIGCMDTANVIILELPCINESKYYSHSGAIDLKVCYINNDSILDIVSLYSVAYSTDKVNILLGNGDGNFTYHSSFAVGTGGDQPVSIEVNDFNGDSINDIIVAIPDGLNGISIFIGNGDATFQSGLNYFIGSRPWDMVSYDIDYDGDNDLLICREQGDDVRMFKNNGNASFSAYGNKSVGWNPQDIKAGYLNNDTIIDLVVVNKLQANISVLIGNTSSSFSSSVNYLAGLNPIEATLGDFNNDSITDIAVTGSTSNMVYVFIGNGDGTFQDNVEYQSGNGTNGISSLDMNNDSIVDLVVTNSTDNNLHLLLGKGNGEFDSAMMYPLNATSRKSVVSDVDKDGDMDLIVGFPGIDSIAILHNCFYEQCMFLFVDSIQSASFGDNDGYASINVLGNNPPFSFLWNDLLQQTTQEADSLFPGTYMVVITDSLGCSDSLQVVVDETICLPDTSVAYAAICEGDSILFSGIYISVSGQYIDTSTNIPGCDSISILNLEVYQPSYSTFTITACDSYTVPSGDETYTLSGVYVDTILNYLDCESFITINLTVNYTSYSTITQTVCDSFLVPSGDETYFFSGVYQDTILNYLNCDSIITIDLTVNHTTYSTIIETVCDNYTVPSGDETYTISGVYQDTVSNYLNCDSIITINLTVNNTSYSTITETVCDSYTVPSGNDIYTVSGFYTDTIPNYNGCDSVITINLTVNQTSYSSFAETVCDSYTVPSGDEIYTVSGLYTDTIPNYLGCDSVITINLTVNQTSYSIITEIVCESYTVPSGDETYLLNGIYTDTIPNYLNCDSIITINLTVNQTFYSTITETACDIYTVPSGDETYLLSGVYQDTISNYSGCDSIITINLTVNQTSFSTIIETACDSYTVPSGDENYTISGVYQDTIPNYLNCDSIITIILTVNNTKFSTITENVCDSYTVPSGDENYTISGVYQDTVTNYLNCDSIITINLTINNTTYSAITETVCDSYTVPSGDESYTISGFYQDTVTNYLNCDSIITINLTVNNTTYSAITETVCDSYTVPSGDESYTISGVYQDTVTNYFGCDSIITIDLNIIEIDTSITQTGNTLQANATSANFQWFDCDNSYSIILGATNQIFTPVNSGNYAVEISQSICKDTSDCYYVQVTGIIENDFGDLLKVFPNPTSGVIIVELGSYLDILDVKVTDISGRIIDQHTYKNIDRFDHTLKGNPGIYILQITNHNKNAVIRILLE